jgi:RHS repeat-associated protein
LKNRETSRLSPVFPGSTGGTSPTGTLYWYMSPGIVAESDLQGHLQSEYVFFDGERVARKDFPGLAVSYYFSDHLKTASVITDSVGNIQSESDYYPWGGELQFLANDSNHYKFTGKERDAETGLDYFGARYYSNGLGRFITPDWAAKAAAVPYADFGNPQSLNLYRYPSNPETFADTDGHQCAGCLPMPLPIDPVESLKNIGKGLANVPSDLLNSTVPMLPLIGLGVPPIPKPFPNIPLEGKIIETVAPLALPAVGELKVATTTAGAVGSYEVGAYGELSARSVVGDGLTLDHIPSNASNLERAAAQKGVPLTPAEKAAVRDQGTAVAVPDNLHRSASPTYGGRNTAAQVQADAANPQAAATRDSQAMVNAASAADKAKAQAAAAKICQAAECK